MQTAIRWLTVGIVVTAATLAAAGASSGPLSVAEAEDLGVPPQPTEGAVVEVPLIRPSALTNPGVSDPVVSGLVATQVDSTARDASVGASGLIDATPATDSVWTGGLSAIALGLAIVASAGVAARVLLNRY